MPLVLTFAEGSQVFINHVFTEKQTTPVLTIPEHLSTFDSETQMNLGCTFYICPHFSKTIPGRPLAEVLAGPTPR